MFSYSKEPAQLELFTGKTFTYTGKQSDFVWNEAGISLHFPAAFCEKEIKVSVAIVDIEDEILPLRYRFVPSASAMYRITASDALPAPVKVQMQHCAVLDKEDSLVFIVAHDGPPYHFELLHGGKFPMGSFYGEIELKTFSFLQIIWQFLGYRMLLSLHIFYHSDSKKQKRATVVVTKNYVDNVRALTGKFKDADRVTEQSMICDYTTKEIALSPLPIEGSGWSVNSTFMPAKIDMEKITYCTPGTTPPNIELHMKWEGMGEPEDEEIEIQVDGGDIKSFTLYCGLMSPATGTNPRNIHRVLDINQDLNYIFDTLQNLNKGEIKSLGCRLGLSQSTVTNTESFTTKSYLKDIMRAWMMKKDSVVEKGEPTIDNLRKALEAEGQRGFAQKLTETLHM